MYAPLLIRFGRIIVFFNYFYIACVVSLKSRIGVGDTRRKEYCQELQVFSIQEDSERSSSPDSDGQPAPADCWTQGSIII